MQNMSNGWMASRQQRTHKLDEASREFTQDQRGAGIVLVLSVEYQCYSPVSSVVKDLESIGKSEGTDILHSQILINKVTILIKADLGKPLPSERSSLKQTWQIDDSVFQISRKHGFIIFLLSWSPNFIFIIQCIKHCARSLGSTQ